MENVKTFEEYLLEGLNTTIEVTNDPVDKLKISLPNDNSDKTFIRREGVIYVMDENGKETKFSEDDPDYEYINKIFKSTRFAKNQDKRNQVERISGKDDEIEDEVEKLYDEDLKDPSTSIIRSNDSIMEFIKKSFKDDEICAYIPIENITDVEREWFNKNVKTVGKGEYLLPIIFSDIRKNHPYKEKGDDVITDKNGKDTIIHIEVKTTGNAIPLITINDDEYPKSLNLSETVQKYQYKCAYSISYYLIGRNFQDSKPSYMVLFDDNSKNNFSGIYIIKCDVPTKSLEKKRLDDDVEDFAIKLYNNVTISDKDKTSHKEKMSLLCKNKKLLCILPLDDFKKCFSDWSTKVSTRSTNTSLSSDDIEQIKKELSDDDNYKGIEKKYNKLYYIYFKYYKKYPNLNKFDIYSLLDIEGKDAGIDNSLGHCKKFIKNDVVSKLKDFKNGETIGEKEVAVGFPHNKGVLKPMCLMYELATGKKILEQHIQTFDEMFND